MKRNRFGSGREEVEQPGKSDGVVRVGNQSIELSVFENALRKGQLHRDFCTVSHPKTSAGFMAWSESVAAFRQSLGVLGWTRDDDENIPRAVSPDGTVSITCVSGNANVGLLHGAVSTRHPRRAAGIRIVRRNEVQIEFMELLPEGERGEALSIQATTWFLLYHRDGDVVRSEISLARAVSADGALIEWAERRILPEIDLNDRGGEGNDGPGRKSVGPESPVEVPITRMAG